jgi:hypothetical protein
VEAAMKSNIVLFCLFLSPSLFAQEYEPNVLLLQVQNPDSISIEGSRIVNGSLEAEAVFDTYPPGSSEKLPHVDSETDGWYLLQYPEGSGVEEIREQLLLCPDFSHVDFDWYGQYFADPNDTYYADANNYQWAIKKAEVPKAWDIVTSPSQVLVAVLDSGIDTLHEDLSQNLWVNPFDVYDGIDNDGNGRVDDVHGWNFFDNNNIINDRELSHGTNVSGVVAAKTYNSVGIAGIAGGWQNEVGARLVGLRVGTNQGFQGSIRVSAARDALQYLVGFRQLHGGTIVANMSFGFCNPNPDPNLQTFIQMVNAARDAGIIMIAASGNSSSCGGPEVELLPPPARIPGVIATGSSILDETVPEERRWTTSLYDSVGKLLVVAPVYRNPAPFYNVATTQWSTTHNSYAFTSFDGTSAAASITTGTVALMLQVRPTMTWDMISDCLAQTADKIGPYIYFNGRTAEVGYGRINTYEAVKSAIQLSYAGGSSLQNATPVPSPPSNEKYVLLRNHDRLTFPFSYLQQTGDFIIPEGVLVIEKNTRFYTGGYQHQVLRHVLEPGAEVVVPPGGLLNITTGDVRYHGYGSCFSTTGGTIRLGSNVTLRVNNGGVLLAQSTPGTIELGDNARLIIETDVTLMWNASANWVFGQNARVEIYGTVNVGDGVTLEIPSNGTLAVHPGSNFALGVNAQVSISGSLISQGTSEQRITFTRSGTSGTWGGIVFENGGSGDITYADFSHCGTALRISDGGTLSVDHCTFSNVSFGAEILADAGGDEEPARSITNSTLSNLSAAGIVVDNFSNLLLDGNAITDSPGATGIVCISSNPTILRMRVEGVKYGMVFQANSSPVLEDGSLGGNNVITGNDVGVECSGGSNANLGLITPPGTDLGGKNSFFGNGLDAYIVDESGPN